MRFDELTQRIDEIAWHEQIEHTLAERLAPLATPDLAAIDTELRALATHVNCTLLDMLKREEGYLVWALRLAAFVEPTQARRYAQPHVDSEDFRVRYWACRMAGIEESSG